MLGKIKFSKIAIVISLTALIWVYADLALDEEFTVSNATIVVAKSDPSLWVSFNGQSSAVIANIVLKGPASKIPDVKRRLKDGSLNLEFLLDAGQEGMIEPDEYPLDLLDFLRKSDQIRGFGLMAESCEPAKLNVNVSQLVEKPLTVHCYDDSGNRREAESIDPPEAKIFVPDDWGREKLTAKVTLTPGEIEQARLAAIERTPYVELGAGQRREAARTVTIKMPPQEDPLTEYTISPTIGYCLSENLQGKYKVEVTNLRQVLDIMVIRATAEAKRAYELQPLPQMTLYILDGDEKKGPTEPPRRKVVYNFPEEYVREGQIELKGEPAEAKFTLTPLAPGDSP